jgi:hypothetical protein
MVHDFDLVMLVVHKVGRPEEIEQFIFLVIHQIMGDDFWQFFRFPALHETAELQFVIIIQEFAQVREFISA